MIDLQLAYFALAAANQLDLAESLCFSVFALPRPAMSRRGCMPWSSKWSAWRFLEKPAGTVVAATAYELYPWEIGAAGFEPDAY